MEEKHREAPLLRLQYTLHIIRASSECTRIYNYSFIIMFTTYY